jgi:hypothetical protein
MSKLVLAILIGLAVGFVLGLVASNLGWVPGTAQ